MAEPSFLEEGENGADKKRCRTGGEKSWGKRRRRIAPHQENAQKNGPYGLAEVYVRCRAKGYLRSFESMCRQIRMKGYKKPEIHRKQSYTRYNNIQVKFLGDKVEVDIKYVPKLTNDQFFI